MAPAFFFRQITFISVQTLCSQCRHERACVCVHVLVCTPVTLNEISLLKLDQLEHGPDVSYREGDMEHL